MKRSLTGIRPSGDLHIGNYLGTIKPALELQKQYECIYFVADLHALTTNKDPKLLQSYSLDIAAAWIVLGLDIQKNILFRQSDVPLVTEYTWYLSCVTGVGFIEKSHAYKDATAQSKDVNVGVFTYPLLMASDILLYEPDVVPVGKDQKQHVEMSRDMAGSFNATYGSDLIKLPEPLIDERVMTIPGLDGRKMSKSYNNVIPIFCDEKTLRKKVMSIKTDSSDAESSKSLDGTLVGDLFTLFASKEQYTDLKSRLAKGGMGWGHAKEELFIAINEHLKEPRTRYTELRADEAKLRSILAEGAERARALALPNLNKLRKAVGVDPMK